MINVCCYNLTDYYLNLYKSGPMQRIFAGLKVRWCPCSIGNGRFTNEFDEHIFITDLEIRDGLLYFCNLQPFEVPMIYSCPINLQFSRRTRGGPQFPAF